MSDAYQPEHCPACLTENDDDATVCANCGAGLTPVGDEDDTAPGTSSTVGLNSRPPRDNLVRARVGGVELRADGDGEPNVLTGHFSTFNDWYEVDSFWEGRFMERQLPGAFADTIENDRSSMRVLFDHGFDPSIGGKPLGPIRDLREDKVGPYYEVPLLDTSYNRDFVSPALTGTLMNGEKVGSQLGASFRFSVKEDQWVRKPKASKHNPEALPERSISRNVVYEFGPVVFPANAMASASARSLTDHWMRRLAGDPAAYEALRDRVGAKVADRLRAAVPEQLRDRSAEARKRQDQLRRRARALLVIDAA